MKGSYFGDGLVLPESKRVFRVGRLTNSSQLAVGWHVVPFNHEYLDPYEWFNTTTFRFTPLVAGDYFFNGCVLTRLPAAGNIYQTLVYKNATAPGGVGSSEVVSLARINQQAADMHISSTGGGALFANGTTDYFDMQIYVGGSNANTFVHPSYAETFFEAFYLGS